MLDEELKSGLASIPPIEQAVDDLYKRAMQSNEQRFYVTIVDIERMYLKEKASLSCHDTRLYVLRQFAEYFSDVVNAGVEEFKDEHSERFVSRLQMLAYSQFWECCGVQRLLHGLVRTIASEQYEPRLWLDDNTRTYHIYQKFREKAKTLSLSISDVIEILYHNEIRNAFAHSDFWIAKPWIMLFGSTITKRGNLPCIHCDTWKMLFDKTCKFVEALFKRRVEAERRLKALAPFSVNLPEFGGPFKLYKDDRGYWVADSGIR